VTLLQGLWVAGGPTASNMEHQSASRKALLYSTPLSQKGRGVREGNQIGTGPNFPSHTRDIRPHVFPMTHGGGLHLRGHDQCPPKIEHRKGALFHIQK
jgi:hypothetical protein